LGCKLRAFKAYSRLRRRSELTFRGLVYAMADIPLRTYVEQLDNLIERKQVDEVVAHCRHILGLYPKHLDTYRMLGKALLEKGRHGDAADIFQRVLSVMPDDFISHVGMSIVREDEANLDAAIWHMERAFESAPANGAIQQELCRLYGRRDGVVPAKARLTRGALARMYAQGGLYLQAEAELKAALAAEVDRIDLLTKLADVYWQTDQPAQAAQTSAAILQKLPYSLEANRILVNVFRAQGRPNDAAVYRQRLEALDPYEAFADPAANGTGAGRVDPAKVTVAKLEYVPGMEESGSPDWLASIGAKFEEPASARALETQPDWLSSAGDTAPAMPAADYQPGQGSVPDWLKDLDAGPAAANSATSAPPDWLQDIGRTAAPAAAQSESNEGLPDWLVTATGPLPADSVPDWMLQSSAVAGSDDADPATGPLTLAGEEAGLPGTPATASDARANDATRVSRPSPAALAPIESAGEIPDWLKTAAPDEAEEDLPDWLKAITAEPLPQTSAQPTTGQPASIPAAASPDLLQATASAPPGTGPLPDWLKLATGESDPAKLAHLLPPEQAPTQTTAVPAEKDSTVAVAATPVEAPTLADAAMAEPAAALDQTAGAAEPTSLATLPDWLKPAALAGEIVAGAVTTESAPQPAETQPAVVTPSVAELAEPEPEMVATSLAAEVEGSAPVPLSNDELPDWLQAAAAVPAQEETPVWLQAAPAGPVLVDAQAEMEPELEIPDWLKAVAAGAPPADPGQTLTVNEIGLTGGADAPTTTQGTPGVPPVVLPDYLQLASPEAIARAEQPLEIEPQVEAAEEDELAAALPAEIPDWLKALAPVSPDQVPALLAAEVPASVSLEDSLSWMDELTAQAGPTGQSITGEPELEEPPAWLAAPVEPAGSEVAAPQPAGLVPGGLGDDTLAAEIPPWAQNEEPGPTDTIVSWLAGKHVPDWLRQPANDAASLPSVEWEPNSAGGRAQPAAVDSLEAAAGPTAAAAAPAEAPAPPEIAQAAAPDLESMDPEAAFRWLESLAAQQGANPEELFTTSAEPTPAAATASFVEAAPAAEAAAEPLQPATEPPTLEAQAPSTPPLAPVAAVADVVAVEPGGLEEFLRQGEAALPVEHLVDTTPSRQKPAIEKTQAEELPPELDVDAAMRWLEGLAAQHGAKPEELLTAPEERTLEAPKWVASEQATAVQATEPAATPSAPVEEAAIAEGTAAAPETSLAAETTVEMARAEIMAAPLEPATTPPATTPPEAAIAPVAEAHSPDADADAAMRWLESLAAQQGANPEELLTAPEERTLEAPAWVSAQAAADAVQPAAEASPFESITPAASPIAEAEPEPAGPEPEPAAAPETPEWLKVLAPAEEKLEAAPPAPLAAVEAAAPAEAAEPPAKGAAADLDKLSRLAERLGAARRAREAEMEARFAEQRNQQEAARRWMEERLEVKQPAPKTTGELRAAALNAAEVPVEKTAPVAAAPEAVRPRPRPSIRARRSRPAPPMSVPATAPEAAAMPVPQMPAPQPVPPDALVHGQAALSTQDYAAAVAHLSVLVEQGQHLDMVVQSLESAAGAGQAPVPVLRLLGDAYLRDDQLQKALDTYRQALRRL
jgi:hypothetical protein